MNTPHRHARAKTAGLCALALLATAAPACAAPLDDYLKARDAYVAKFDPGDKELDYKKVEKPLAAAMADLEKKLRALVGAVDIPGGGQGKSNLGSLIKGDMDFGKLDGIVFATGGGKIETVVTTRGLVDRWLVEHKDWWDKGTPNVPQKASDALGFDGFYTQALSGDAAISKFADLPVTKPDGAETAFAMLDLRSQDVGVGKPDEIIAALVRGDRVFLVSMPLAGKAPAFAPCDAAWKAFEKKIAKADGDAASNLEEEGAAAYRTCYVEKLKATPAWQAAVAQAQKTIDALPK